MKHPKYNTLGIRHDSLRNTRFSLAKRRDWNRLKWSGSVIYKSFDISTLFNYRKRTPAVLLQNIHILKLSIFLQMPTFSDGQFQPM